MRQDQAKALRDLLRAVIPKEKFEPVQIDALARYIAEVTKTEDEAIQKLSGILQNDPNSIAILKTSLQMEVLRERMADYRERMADYHGRLCSLEQSTKGDQSNGQEHSKWPMVQAIFTAMSFIAATVALLKAFGFLHFPWLS